MRLFNLLRRRSPPPPTPAPNAKPELTLTLRRAPTFTPLPVTDPLLSAAWLRFQQAHPGATFTQFLGHLRADTDRLAAEIAKATKDLDIYR